MTEVQKALVRDNLGLVAVHLRRNVRRIRAPRRDREWEDLFQEGCLGLAKAAATYRAERGIPFAAFALPRIHQAVSKALHGSFATVRVPVPVRGRPGRMCAAVATIRDAPRVFALSRARAGCLPAHELCEQRAPNGETVGDRLRGIYERAVRAAEQMLSGRRSVRGDLDRLAHVLVEERLLIPQESSRMPLRRIARETHSSSARVAQTEQRLTAMIREKLETDPQFAVLRQVMRQDPRGAERPITAGIECALAAADAEELVRRFRHANPVERACLLDGLFERSRVDLESFFRAHALRLSGPMRQELLRTTVLQCGSAARCDHRPAGSKRKCA